jgi:SPP1 gp7 family putative phage head morphogenesis protein
MCEVCSTYTVNELAVNDNNIDPTKTVTLRNAFARDMRTRFKKIESVIKKAIVDKDIFGLNIQTNELYVPSERAFDFLTSEEKIVAFIKWLEEQVKFGLLDIRDLEQVGKGIHGSWTNKYVFDSYKKGVIRARIELKKAGVNVPTIDQSGGIAIALAAPVHLDRLGILYTRVFTDLKGITDVMDSAISRILAQGIADGDNPRLLARKLLATINGSGMGDLGITDSLGRFIPARRRAEMLARTEIIRAHHVATIQEYRNWAVEGVFVKAEWRTAGDKRVCPICSSMQGEIFTLDQIEKMIPAHTFCRCIALPFLQSLVTKRLRMTA